MSFQTDYDLMIELGKQHGIDMAFLAGRRMGKTTRLAFLVLAECYEKPGEWVSVKDHHPHRIADRYLMDKIFDMVQELDLDSFEFSQTRIAVRLNFKPFITSIERRRKKK